MAKSIVITLLSLFLITTSSDNPSNHFNNVPGPQSGVLQKLIVANGTISLKLDLAALSGRRSKSQLTELRLDAAPDSFFSIRVFNDQLRRIEPTSMSLVAPKDTRGLPAALSVAAQNLVLESLPWGEQYELVFRDKNTGAVLFNIEGQESNYSPDTQQLTIQSGRLIISEEFANSLKLPAAAKTTVGEFSLTTNMQAIEVIQVVDGEVQSSTMPQLDQVSSLVPGPDVIVGNLFGLAQFGASNGTQVGLAVGTDSCNAGNVPLNWLATPNNDHPVIPQNLYRMSGGTGNDQRFEQVGQSNVKHAFTALQEDICGFGCNATASTSLGTGCSDPYSASLNAGQTTNNLGSRAWINPFTGAYPRADQGTPPNSHTGHTHNGTSHRIVVEMNDLNSTLNTGASYYAEASYVTPHEYAWCQAHPGECNMYNNASYRRYNVSGTTSYSFTPVGNTERQKPAINAWTGATINEIRPAPGTDGIAFIGYKVTQTSPGVWHYEYAVYNQNLDRSIQSVSIPYVTGTNLTNVGFHAPPQQPAWANDGTVGSAGYSSAAWTPTQGANSITWATETFAQNQNANAIRWGTLYNFRFDSNRPPQFQNATVGFFKTGAPVQVQVQAPSFESLTAINDVAVTETDAGTVSANFNVTLTPASADTVTVNWATADGTATAGNDYVANSGTVTFNPGQTSQQVSVTVNSDNLVEPNETFFVNLTNPTNTAFSDNQGKGTINNDDVIASLPPNFNETQITGNGLSNATAMAIHPDGRIFVAQQTGELRVIKNGAVLATPFLTVPVNSTGERGLLGVAFDPNYATNKLVYVYYTATSPTVHNRISRFIADSSNEDVALAGSEEALMDLETLSATNHNGGAIHFGPDGKLYIAVGENANSANSQLLTNRLGKILRINADGSIPGDNPLTFPNISGSPAGSNRAIWAVGLRNPYTFNFQQGTGRMFINDVGQSTWEEINLGVAGANYGWGTCEGTCSTPGMTNPVYQYSSAVGSPCAITGGAFYNPTTPTFPGQYVGKYFFSDFCGGWMKTIDPNNPPATGTAPDFITNINSPVDIQVANDGSLYYLARGSNSVFRVQYFGGPTLAVDDVTVGEGNGTNIANFTVTLSPAATSTVTVQYATSPGSATSTVPTDYTSASGTLTFLPGETSKTVPVTISHDTTFEPNETFTVNLTNPTNAALGDSSGTGTIVDNDSQPTISINDPTVTEGNSGTTTATFVISLSNTSSQNVTVNYATASGTATIGTDFVSTSGTATVVAGSSLTTVLVTVNGDTTFEPNETFFVNLTNPVNATINDAQGMGTINNDDVNQSNLSINDVSVNEGNSGTTTAQFTVSLSVASADTVTVLYSTGAGSATPITPNNDYVDTSGTVTFNPGQTSQNINITVNGDTVFEPNETFSVNLSTATNAGITDAQGIGTITNDDAKPLITINDVAVQEGNSGTSNAVFTVSLSNASSQEISVRYVTANGTATSVSGDYGLADSTLIINAGQLSKTISIPIGGDTTFEANETFTINLSLPANALIDDIQGVGTITNDDAPPAVSIDNVTVTEGNSGSVTAIFTISITAASGQDLTVNYATAGDTATSGTDFVAATGTATITAGQLSTTVTVTVNGDITFETNETFNVNLSTPSNATISDNQGVGTITNDDAPPSIAIDNVTVTEGNSGTVNAVFTISIPNASSQDATVNYATASDTATSGTDFVAATGTATITAGQLSTTVTVIVNSETVFEPNESYFVNLSGPTNATISDNQGVGTITNDDTQPAISINDVSVNEGNSGTSVVTFTVLLSNASSQTITVNYATADGTATAGNEYVATNGTVTFTPGQVSQTVNVTINGDVFNEPSSVTFNVNLTTPTNATISDALGVGTITDDDSPLLATEQSSQRAIALDSMFFVRDPFFIENPSYFGADKRTRVILFSENLLQTTGLNVTATAVDAMLVSHNLDVEFVGTLPTFPGFTQIVVKLPDGVTTAQDLQVTITARGRTSNVVLVGVKP